MNTLAYLLSLVFPSIKIKPTHYVRLDMIDLAFTANQYQMYLESRDIRNPSAWTPCIVILGRYISITHKV